MTIKETKIQILKRSYRGNFEEGVEPTFDLHIFAKDLNLDESLVFKAFEDLRMDGLIEEYASGGIVAPTPRGLVFCENEKIIDENTIACQVLIRKKLITALDDLIEQPINDNMINWNEWIVEAGVSNQDFSNNEKILIEWRWIEANDQSGQEYSISALGKMRAKEIKQSDQRLKAFESLANLESVTPQQRGHNLEDLIFEIVKNEGWEVEKRIKTKGEEIDLIFKTDSDYFLCSCKWEIKATQPKEIDLLVSRVLDRATTKGIIFSMSGLSEACFDKLREKMSSAIIIPFGPKDISNLLQDKMSISELLDLKFAKLIKHKKVLYDGELK